MIGVLSALTIMSTPISYNRPKLEPTLPSVYRVVREGETFEIIVDEELSDRDKEALRLQFTLDQSRVLSELLCSNIDSLTAIRTLFSDSYNLPIPTPITSKTPFLRDEMVRILEASEVESLLSQKIREQIESLKFKQMEIGLWLYHLPDEWIQACGNIIDGQP